MPYRMILENRVARFMQHISMEGDCWVWAGNKTWNGYGVTSLNGRRTVAHRVSYQLFCESIPDGLDLDHLCRNRACCNPKHLEPVSRGENLRRGFVARGCKNGHPYTEEGFYVVHRSDGRTELRCKVCHRERNKNAKRRARERMGLSRKRAGVRSQIKNGNNSKSVASAHFPSSDRK